MKPIRFIDDPEAARWETALAQQEAHDLRNDLYVARLKLAYQSARLGRLGLPDADKAASTPVELRQDGG